MTIKYKPETVARIKGYFLTGVQYPTATGFGMRYECKVEGKEDVPCKTRVSITNGGIAELIKHLRSHHNITFKEVEDMQMHKLKKKKTDSEHDDSDDNWVGENLIANSRMGNKLLFNLFVNKKLPMSLLESDEFIAYSSFLRHEYKVPGRKAFTEKMLPSFYYAAVDCLKEVRI